MLGRTAKSHQSEKDGISFGGSTGDSTILKRDSQDMDSTCTCRGARVYRQLVEDAPGFSYAKTARGVGAALQGLQDGTLSLKPVRSMRTLMRTLFPAESNS